MTIPATLQIPARCGELRPVFFFVWSSRPSLSLPGVLVHGATGRNGSHSRDGHRESLEVVIAAAAGGPGTLADHLISDEHVCPACQAVLAVEAEDGGEGHAVEGAAETINAVGVAGFCKESAIEVN